MRITMLVTFAGLLLFGQSLDAAETAKTIHFIRTQGSRLVLGQTEVRLRGLALSRRDVPSPSDSLYRELADLGANVVRLPFSYRDLYADPASGVLKTDAWEWIDAHLALAREYGMWLILQDTGIEGWQPVPIKGRAFDYSIWEDVELQNRLVKLWATVASRYRDEPHVAGYSIFFEPVTSKSRKQWGDLAQRTVDEIRRVDPRHIVFVERIYGENELRRELSGVDLAPELAFVPVDDDNVVYEFYFFERDEYTHQFAPWREDRQKARTYPDEGWAIKYRESSGLERSFPFGRDYLEFYLKRQLEFGKQRNVPMSIWGFGAQKACFEPGRGGLQWLEDVLGLFNETGVQWTLWGYHDPRQGIADDAKARALLKKALGGE